MLKNKLNVVLILALLAISAAMISKANVLAGKVPIIGCFADLTLTDLNGIASYSPIVDDTDCDVVRQIVNINSYYYLKAITSPSPVSVVPCTQDVDFCCVYLEPTTDNPNAPAFDLGDGIQQQYQIFSKYEANILCRP